MDFYDFKSLDISEQVEFIESLDNWNDAEPEFYIRLCDEVGLNYSDFDDPDVMFSAILERI